MLVIVYITCGSHKWSGSTAAWWKLFVLSRSITDEYFFQEMYVTQDNWLSSEPLLDFCFPVCCFWNLDLVTMSSQWMMISVFPLVLQDFSCSTNNVCLICSTLVMSVDTIISSYGLWTCLAGIKEFESILALIS